MLCLVVSNVESENKYIIKVPRGETLYIANEMSTGLQRLFCGSRRKLTLSISDHTRQEAFLLSRRLAASSCIFPCRLQVKLVSFFGIIIKIIYIFREIF